MNRTPESQYGFLPNGKPRHCLPQNFWKSQQWQTPEDVAPNDYEIECMHIDAVTRYLCQSVPNLIIKASNVNVWISPSQKNNIPGVYRCMIGDQNRVYIHRSIVFQMQRALISSDELIWERPAAAENTTDADCNANAINVLKERVSVLSERIRETRKDNTESHELMRKEYRARFEHLFRAVEELYKQFNLTIPEQPTGLEGSDT